MASASDLWSEGREFDSRPVGNNSGQVVHTNCASVTKQYNLVPAKGRWCSAAGKVTVGLASHRPCVTDFVIYPPMAVVWEMSTSPMPSGHGTFTTFTGGASLALLSSLLSVLKTTYYHRTHSSGSSGRIYLDSVNDDYLALLWRFLCDTDAVYERIDWLIYLLTYVGWFLKTKLY